MSTSDLPTSIDDLAALRPALTLRSDRRGLFAEKGNNMIRITWDTQEPDDHGWAVDMLESGKVVDSDSLDTVRDLDNAISWLSE